jgi:hypothetical protein
MANVDMQWQRVLLPFYSHSPFGWPKYSRCIGNSIPEIGLLLWVLCIILMCYLNTLFIGIFDLHFYNWWSIDCRRFYGFLCNRSLDYPKSKMANDAIAFDCEFLKNTLGLTFWSNLYRTFTPCFKDNFPIICFCLV